MENEKTESRELVPVETVEADLVFDPCMDKSLVGYGSRKIIRASLKNQLREGYKCLDYKAVEFENEKPSKCDANTAAIVNLLVDGAYTKKELAAKTRLTETQVGHVLNVLMKFEFAEMIKIGRTFYYKISENE